MKCLNNKILYLAGLLTYLGLCTVLFAQGTLGETLTTLELQEQMESRSGEARPKPPTPAEQPAEANNAEQPPDMARFEKVAQKLFYSLQTGNFDQADFSEEWLLKNIPSGSNFTDTINSFYRPLLAQYGRAEKLGGGKIGDPPWKATFPVQFSGGKLEMTIWLAEQDKVLAWMLMPTTVPAAAPASPAMREQPATPAETQVISPALPQDSNEPDIPDINDFNSFQREINRMNIETRSEEQQWMGPLERKVELARAIDELVAAQLRFIRKLAESEDANQTVKAIDLVLRQRRERLNNLETKLSEEIREERQQQTTEPRGRMPRRERQEQRPPRRTRETPAEEQ